MRRDSGNEPTGGGTSPEYGQASYGSPYGDSGWGAPPPQVARHSDPPPPDPGPYAPGAAPVATPPRGRPGLIVLVAFLVQLVVVGAVGNPWVSDKLLESQNGSGTLTQLFSSVPLSLAWRFSAPGPRGGFTQYQLPPIVGLAVFFVVAALLTLAVVRGAVTFWRIAIAVWMATIVGAFVGGIGGRIAAPSEFVRSGFGGRTGYVLFLGNNAPLLAGVVVGVLAGLVAALVAVATRRPGVVAVPAAAPEPPRDSVPDEPPPWYGTGGAAAGGTAGSPSFRKDPVREPVREPVRDTSPVSGPAAEQATTAFPVAAPRRDDPPSAQLPETQAARPVVERDDATRQIPQQQFPKPPDDEDMGHHPDEH